MTEPDLGPRVSCREAIVSQYFHNGPKRFARLGETPRCDDPDVAAREMIRIFGHSAEGLALSQSRKFARRGDEEGIRVWASICSAIGKARLQPG